MEQLIRKQRFKECYELIDVYKYSVTMQDLMCCLKYITDHKCVYMLSLYEYILDFLPEHPTIDLILQNMPPDTYGFSNHMYILSYVTNLSKISDVESFKKINDFISMNHNGNQFIYMSNNVDDGWIECHQGKFFNYTCFRRNAFCTSSVYCPGFFTKLSQQEYDDFMKKYTIT